MRFLFSIVLVIATVFLWGCSGQSDSISTNNDFVGAWGSDKLLDGQMFSPNGFAIQPSSGNIYVMDNSPQSKHFIHIFSPSGQFLARRNIPYQEGFLSGIAFAPDGTLYTADVSLGRIIHLSTSGSVLGIWGGDGSREGHLYVNDLKIGQDGLVYLLNKRVQVFNSEGTMIRSWLVNPQEPFNNPASLVLHGSDFLYISDLTQVHTFTTHGQWVSTWDLRKPDINAYRLYVGLAVDTNGDVFAMGPDWGIQHYSSDGTYIGSWAGQGEAFESYPPRIDIDPDRGTMYTLGLREFGIQVYDRNGQLLSHVGDVPSSAPGQFYWPSRVVVAGDGSVLVQDGFRIQRFSSQGTFMNGWSIPPTGFVWFGYPMTAASDESILLYIDGTKRMRRYSLLGELLREWTWDSSIGEMNVDELGRIWITDSSLDRVQAISIDGGILKSWSVQDPFGIAAIEGLVAVSNQYGLHLFDEDGKFLGSLDGGESGSTLLAIVDQRLYASNLSGDVSVFDLSGVRQGLGGTLIHKITHAGPTFSGQSPPRDLAVGPDGDIYVPSPRTAQVFHYRLSQATAEAPTAPQP